MTMEIKLVYTSTAHTTECRRHQHWTSDRITVPVSCCCGRSEYLRNAAIFGEGGLEAKQTWARSRLLIICLSDTSTTMVYCLSLKRNVDTHMCDMTDKRNGEGWRAWIENWVCDAWCDNILWLSGAREKGAKTAIDFTLNATEPLRRQVDFVHHFPSYIVSSLARHWRCRRRRHCCWYTPREKQKTPSTLDPSHTSARVAELSTQSI